MDLLKQGTTVFSIWDDVVLHPEHYFSQDELSGLIPYHIFTGVGVMVVLENDRAERETLYFKNKNDFVHCTKRLQKNKDLIVVDECFFAHVVPQNMSDPFQISTRRTV